MAQGTVTYTDAPGLQAAITAAGYTLVERGGSPTNEWIADDASAVQAVIDGYAGSAAELSYNQGIKIAALADHLSGLISAGRTIGEKTYQIDDASRANIAAAGSLAASVLASTPGAVAWSADFFWITADNSHQPMSAADCYAFAQDIAAYYTTLVVVNRALKDALKSAATSAVVNAIDVTAGWPSNP